MCTLYAAPLDFVLYTGIFTTYVYLYLLRPDIHSLVRYNQPWYMIIKNHFFGMNTFEGTSFVTKVSGLSTKHVSLHYTASLMGL